MLAALERAHLDEEHVVPLEELLLGELVTEAVSAALANLEGGVVLRPGGHGALLGADQEALVVREVVAMREVVAQRLGACRDPEQARRAAGRSVVVGQHAAREEVDVELRVLIDADDRHRAARGVGLEDREDVPAPGRVADDRGHAPRASEDRLECVEGEWPLVDHIDVGDDLDPGVGEGHAGGVRDLVRLVHECLLRQGFERVGVVVLFQRNE